MHKLTGALIAALILCANCQINAQNAAGDQNNFVIHFSQKTDTTGLQIKYYITGAFISFRAFVKTQPNVRDYQIPLLRENRSARSLKVIIYGPKYHTRTLNFPSLRGQKKSIDIDLEPIGTAPFSGKVALPENFAGGTFRVQVMYIPLWECAFFNQKKCLQGLDNMTTGEFKEDGSFQIDLPDFAGDPAIASLRNPGQFYFAIEGEQNGKYAYYWLITKKGTPGSKGIKAAKTYPPQQFFLSEKK